MATPTETNFSSFKDKEIKGARMEPMAMFTPTMVGCMRLETCTYRTARPSHDLSPSEAGQPFSSSLNCNLTCPGLVSFSLQEGQCSFSAELNAPDVSSPCNLDDNQLAYQIYFPSGSGTMVGEGLGRARFDFQPGDSRVVYFLIDDLGDTVSRCEFTLRIVDLENPQIECSDELNFQLDRVYQCDTLLASSVWAPKIEDNCPAQSSFSCKLTFPDGRQETFEDLMGLPNLSFPVGRTLISSEYRDGSGNGGVCRTEIIVRDMVAPEVETCPDNRRINVPAGTCDALVPLPELSLSNSYCDTTILQRYSISPGGMRGAVPDNVRLPVGLYTIEYELEDESGNSSTCTFEVDITDPSPPQLTDCPEDRVFQASANSCAIVDTIQLPGVIGDDCLEAVRISDTLIREMEFDASGNLDALVFDFTNAGLHPYAPMRLRIEVFGDVDDERESFAIFDEDDNLFATSPTNEEASCSSPAALSQSLSMAELERWLEDGRLQFEVRPTILPTGMPKQDGDPDDQNINNFCPEGENNAVPRILFILSYPEISDFYYEISGVTQRNLTRIPRGTTVVDTFQAGLSTVELVYFDRGGNRGSCRYTVELEDDQMPEIECRENFSVELFPLTLDTFNLRAEDLITFVSDQCGLSEVLVVDDEIDCEAIGRSVPVEVFAVDNAGNTASCQVEVILNEQQLEPQYISPVCTGDTLFLLPDLMVNDLNSNITVEWRDKEGVLLAETLSHEIADVDASDGGIYSFTVISEDGECRATGDVLVEITEVPENLEIDIDVREACVGQNFRLNTTPWNSANVSYEWYRGVPGSGALIGTTSDPFLDWSRSIPGVAEFYVLAANGSCATSPSATAQITINEIPTLDLPYDTMSLCENEELRLVSNVTAEKYEWRGPVGFSSTEPEPIVSTEATQNLAGWYYLRINNNDCWSLTDSVYLTVVPQPMQPQLDFNSPLCEGEDLFLSTNASADTFIWLLPDGSEVKTDQPLYGVPPAQVMEGEFQLQLQVNGCLSQLSEVRSLEINQVGDLGLSSNAPLCENERLLLTAEDIPGAEYNWTGPGLNSNERNPIVEFPLSGVYILNVVTAEGCEKSDSLRVAIERLPEVQGIDVNLNPRSCLTGRDSLVLRPIGIPQSSDFEFFWTLPNGMNRSVRNLVLPNATSALNGTYELLVRSGEGCPSEISRITLNYKDAPAAPQIVFNEQLCEGEQLVLTCSRASDPDPRYLWQTPNGILTTLQPELRIQSLSKARDEGFYSVSVDIEGCTSAFSQRVNVEINARPARPEIVGDSVYCEGEQLVLSTPLIPDLTYDWTGPVAEGDENELIIDGITPLDAGEYSLRVFDANDCPSELSLRNIEVFAAPQRPILTANNTTLCPGDTLQLDVNLAGIDSVHWQLPSGEFLTTMASSLVLYDSALEVGLWRARGFSGQCASVWSDFIDIQIDRPYSVEIAGDTELCANEPLQLSTSLIQMATYDWFDPQGRVIGNQQRIVVNNPDEGIYTLRFSSPLGCRYEDSIELSLFRNPTIDSIVIRGSTCVNGNQDIELVPYINLGDDPNLNFNWTPALGTPGVDSIYTINNARSNNSGDYFLEVSDGNNCSTDRELVNLQLYTIPPLPVITQRDTICDGDDLILRTQDFAGSSERYVWNTPLGQIETNDPELRLPEMTLSNNGVITVQVVTPFCNSSLSLEYLPAIKEVPQPPIITVAPSICAGDTLFLEASRVPGVPQSSTQYSWRGPQGFAPGVRNPVIPNVSESRTGYYKVRTQVRGCWSDFSDSVFVQVDAIPAAPIIVPVDDICLDNQRLDVELAIDPRSSRPGALYQFYEAGSEDPLLPFSPGLTIDLPLDTLLPGSYSIFARTLLNGCLSAKSLTETFDVYQIPDTIIAKVNTDSIIRCGDQPFLSAVQLPEDSNFSGLWRQIGGPNPIDINAETSSFTSINWGQLRPGETYVFEWSIAYGTCGTYSRDTLHFLDVDGNQEARVVDNSIELCNQDFAILEALPASGSVRGRWIQSRQQERLGVDILNPASPTTRVEGMEIVDNQVYTFNWQLEHPICGVISSELVEVVVNEQAPCEAFAGQDQIICSAPTVDLQAGASGGCSGFWRTPGNAIIESPGLSETNISDLEVGDNVFIWSLENLQCGLYDEDTVIVTYYLASDAMDDVFDLEFADIRALNVLENDLNTEDARLEILNGPENGKLEYTADSIVYYADLEFVGEDLFTYRLCDLRCPSFCDTAQVDLTVGANLGCQIPTLITPNGDDINDVFLIPCLASDNYPKNKVSIFNSWGDAVFEAAPYDNNWRGTYNGADLPEGTYYYVVDFGDATPVESGFVILQR